MRPVPARKAISGAAAATALMFLVLVSLYAQHGMLTFAEITMIHVARPQALEIDLFCSMLPSHAGQYPQRLLAANLPVPDRIVALQTFRRPTFWGPASWSSPSFLRTYDSEPNIGRKAHG